MNRLAETKTADVKPVKAPEIIRVARGTDLVRGVGPGSGTDRYWYWNPGYE